jgi:4-amino-4-deoxy-L-arabinose transferase-like glycosyltransferase
MNRFNIPKILPWLLLVVPLNIYVIGDWLGTGIQWALFRYQQTYLGSNLIILNQDVQYILDGFISGRTAVSVLVWITGFIFFLLALLVFGNTPRKSGVRHAGILCILYGLTCLISDVIQYGIFLHGPAGICIPIGIPIIFIVGWWLYTEKGNNDQKLGSPEERTPSLVSSIKISIITFFENHTIICIFLILFFAYNTVYVVNINGDTVPATFFPLSILQYHNLFFDQFGQVAINANTDYGFLLINSHYYSLFPVVTPVLVIPIYAVSFVLFHVLSIHLVGGNILLLAKTCAAIITALSGVIVYLVCRELFSKRIALLSTFIYAFATSTWSISSQSLWQQGMGELLLILMLYFIVRNEKSESCTHIMALGILSGLFVFNRPPDALLVIPTVYYVIRFYRNHLNHYALAGIVSGLPFLLYNLLIFGTIFGGYSHDFHLYVFNGNFVSHYLGLLLSPNVGLFIFTPVLILSVVGYFRLKDIRNPHLASTLFVFGPVIFLTILTYSFFDGWFSTWCYGPRYLIGIVPVLIIYCALFFDATIKAPANRLQKLCAAAIIIILIAASVIIQFIGVYYYVDLPSKGMDNQRVWEWNDSVIAGSFDAGFGKNITITVYSFPPLPPLLQYKFTGGG